MNNQSRPVSIRLLAQSRLGDAIDLVNEIFPDDDGKPGESLRAIFEPHLHPLDWTHGICDRVCWAASENAEIPLLGVVGLYRLLGDPSGLYLGWFGVKKSARGQGVGEQLLVHAIAEAMRSGVPYLRLETSDEPYLAAANRLYENHGLVVFRRDQESLQATWPTVWRELSLTSKAFP